MIKMTLTELRKRIRSVLLEVLQQDDLNDVVRKIVDLEVLTEVDIARFAEMTIDSIADDNPEYSIDAALIERGWNLLKHLTTPDESGKNRQPVVVRLESTCRRLGNERKRAARVTDWAVKDEIDYKVDEFLQNTVEEYARKIVGGYNQDVINTFETHRQKRASQAHLRNRAGREETQVAPEDNRALTPDVTKVARPNPPGGQG